jgi:hypothetical protein
MVISFDSMPRDSEGISALAGNSNAIPVGTEPRPWRRRIMLCCQLNGCKSAGVGRFEGWVAAFMPKRTTVSIELQFAAAEVSWGVTLPQRVEDEVAANKA